MILGNTVAQIAFRLTGIHLGRFAVAVVFLFSFSSSWAVCTQISQRYPAACNSTYEVDRYCGPSSNECATYPERVCTYSCGVPSWGASGENIWWCRVISCADETEADSLRCVMAGNSWVNGNCQEPLDSTACAPYKQECEQIGGKFTGNVVSTAVSPTGCLSFCNMCNSKAQENYRRAMALQCCRKGMVPPGEVTHCDNSESAGSSDMSFSNLDCDYRGGYDCECETLDGENAETFNAICNDDEWPEPDDGSSSSGGGGSSSSSEGDAPPGSSGDDWEYDYRDSLHKIIKYDSLQLAATDGILGCLLTPVNCDGLKFPDSIKTPVFAFDTAFRKYLKPLMDSTLKLDSNQLKALLKLDTNMLKQMRNDTVSWKNDTNTWRTIEGAVDQVDTSIHSMNDTTRKWFKRIADSIGVSTDSLAAHIDSIVRHIPDSILDSIFKYQAYATDNFDSVLYGKGKGFSLVDSLIDSVVSYFKMAGHYDSLYRVMFTDSMGVLHGEFVELPGRNASAIGSALGYGDTATSTLRGDLEGIRTAIEGIGDGIGSGVVGAMDSAWGDGTSPSDTGWGVYGDYDAESDSVGNRYLRGLGGLLDSAINDTAFNSIFATGGDTVGWDTAARLPSVDSMKARLDSSIVAQRTEVEDSLQAAFDTLKDEFMLLNYDSLILAPLGMRVPNSNTCPEHCFVFDITGGSSSNMSWMGNVGTLNFGLCKPLPGFSFDVLYLVRIMGRVLTALFCVYIGLWFIAGRKQ